MKVKTSGPLESIKHKIKKTSFWSSMNPRSFHAYCVGAPKTGTHSMAKIFSDYHHSSHEPTNKQLSRLIINDNTFSVETKKYLWRRDRYLWLEMESSHLISHFVEALTDIFPKSKFILTVRHPVDWLESIVNQHMKLTFTDGHISKRLRNKYHSTKKCKNNKKPDLLSDAPHHICGYLTYWNSHNIRILENIKQENLMVLKTSKISDKIDKMCDFLDVSISNINTDKTKYYQNNEKKEILDSIDKEEILKRVNLHCGKSLDILKERGIYFKLS